MDQGNQTTEVSSTSSTKKPNYLMLGLVAIALIAVIAGGLMFMNSQNANQTQEAAMEAQPTTANVQGEAMTVANEYKDGEYNVTGNYQSPGGAEELDVTVTLEDGVIKEAEVVPKASRPTSKLMQEDFTEHFKEQVIGKNIDEVALVKVSGSSLAPKGFNDAIEKIKIEAQS